MIDFSVEKKEKLVQVGTVLPKSVYEAVSEIATSFEISLSMVVRMIVEDYVNREKTK